MIQDQKYINGSVMNCQKNKSPSLTTGPRGFPEAGWSSDRVRPLLRARAEWMALCRQRPQSAARLKLTLDTPPCQLIIKYCRPIKVHARYTTLGRAWLISVSSRARDRRTNTHSRRRMIERDRNTCIIHRLRLPVGKLRSHELIRRSGNNSFCEWIPTRKF